MRLKEWHAFQLGNDRFFIFVAIMNLKKAAFATVDIYDKKNKKQYRYEKKLSPWNLKFPSNLIDSKVSYKSNSFNIHVNNKLIHNKIRVSFHITSNKTLPKISGIFTALADSTEPIVACIPFTQSRGMYAHKGIYPMEGILCLGSEEIQFSKKSSFFIIDDQKGYYPYIMKWDWCTASGYNEKKQLIGFNLTRNQSIDQDNYNENCLWINGKLHLLPSVTFTKHKNLWIIKDKQDTVNLAFSIKLNNNINTNALILESHYKGPYGTFNGYIKDSSGNKVQITNIFGMGEDFYVRC